MRFAKESGTAVFVVGHVTKGGGIAGPKTLEHIVDEEKEHSGNHGWAERWLSTLPIERVQSARNKWIVIDERVAEVLHSQLAVLEDEGAAR